MIVSDIFLNRKFKNSDTYWYLITSINTNTINSTESFHCDMQFLLICLFGSTGTEPKCYREALYHSAPPLPLGILRKPDLGYYIPCARHLHQAFTCFSDWGCGSATQNLTGIGDPGFNPRHHKQNKTKQNQKQSSNKYVNKNKIQFLIFCMCMYAWMYVYVCMWTYHVIWKSETTCGSLFIS